MDFDFSDDQDQLRDAVRKWVDKGYSFERRRAARQGRRLRPRRLARELAELGLCGLYIEPDAWRHGHGPGRRHGGDGRAGPRHRARTAWHSA